MMYRVLSAVGLAVLVNACTPVGVVVGAGATAGTMAMEDRGIKQGGIDIKIKGLVVDAWFRKDTSLATNLTATVYNNVVMVTGVLPNEQLAAEAISLTWKTEGVTNVLNEIQVDPDSGISDYAHDTVITTKLKTALTFDEKVMAVNYTLNTVKGVVYIMGAAQSQAELDYVISLARAQNYVRRVVSHVIILAPKQEPQ